MSYGMNSPSASTGSASGQNQAGMKEKVPSGYKKSVVNTYSPEAMQLLEQLMQHLGPDSYLSKIASGDQSFFEEMEAPAMRQFQGLQGDLASRFSGAGMGSRKGSGFMNAANQQTSDFAQDLQSKRQQMQMEAIKELMGMGSSLLSKNNPYETDVVEKNKPWWQELLKGGAQTGSEAFFKKLFK